MGLFGNTKENIFYILDIGSSSVGGSIVSIKKGGNPKTLFQTRKELDFQEELNFERFLSGTVKGVGDILSTLKKTEYKKPKKVHIFLASPWFAAQNRTVIFRQGEKFKVTQDLVQEMVYDEIKAFKEKKFAESKREMVTLEANIIDFTLNGYETLKPYGKMATELKITFFISISTQKVFKAFKDAVISGVHDDDMLFHTFPFASFSSISEIAATPDNFLLADINGEMTDIVTVRNGILVETTSFPVGRNFVKRKIIEKMNVPKSSVYPMVDLYNKGKIEESLKIKMQGALSEVGQEWVNELSNAFDSSSFEHLLPNHFYVLSDVVLEPVFVNLIKSKSLERFVGPNQKFQPTPITPQLLGAKIENQPKGSMDVFMLLEAIFLQKLFDVQ